MLRLRAPNGGFLARLGMFVYTSILPAHLYAGTDWESNPANLAPVGTGPYQLAAWERGSTIETTRVTKVLAFRGLERTAIDLAEAGEKGLGAAMIDRLAGTTIRLAHGSAAASEIDQTLGSLLESQTDEVALLLLAIPKDAATVGDDALFILAAANSPLAGELESIAWQDLPPTLLATRMRLPLRSASVFNGNFA